MIQTFISVGSRYPVDRKAIRRCVQRVLAEHSMHSADVSVSIVGTRQMTKLHLQYMKLEGSTDVLSFPQRDPSQENKEFPNIVALADQRAHLGDIVVCFPEAVKGARRFGRMVDAHICFLVEHGLLHLLGFHHE